MGNMMTYIDGLSGWTHGFGGIFMILFWGLVIFAIFAIIKALLPSSGNDNSSKTALDILKERYARGEIELEEFEKKKKNLMS